MVARLGSWGWSRIVGERELVKVRMRVEVTGRRGRKWVERPGEQLADAEGDSSCVVR